MLVTDGCMFSHPLAVKFPDVVMIHAMVVDANNSKKIMQQGLVTIIAEWSNVDNIADDDGEIKDKLTMKLNAESVLKIFRRISEEDVSFLGLVLHFPDQIG